jgi:16S rRNA (adenine1518-N6/adenine1519-N6)-dimethyltransferase
VRPPRKSLGQHILHDRSVIARIVAAVDPQPGERLVEIGPGRGALTVPLLFRLLDQQGAFRDLHVMLQREVVERMTAAPDTPEYGRLTVALAARCRVTRLFVVKPGAFTPPPQVDSAVARLVPDAALAARITDPAAFDRLLTRAFSMRRKRLANALKGLLDEPAIAACGVDPGARPGTLPPDAFIRLANALI